MDFVIFHLFELVLKCIIYLIQLKANAQDIYSQNARKYQYFNKMFKRLYHRVK